MTRNPLTVVCVTRFKGRAVELSRPVQPSQQIARRDLRSILQPDTVVDPRYVTISITTRDGQQYIGVKRDETKDLIRMYDASSMPPVLRVLPQVGCREDGNSKGLRDAQRVWEKYSKKDLLDLVTYLKAVDRIRILCSRIHASIRAR